jgi:hypothetical protein
MFPTWVSTVLRVIYSRPVISGLESPAPTSSKTSASRLVSAPIPLGPVRMGAPSDRSSAPGGVGEPCRFQPLEGLQRRLRLDDGDLG